jgi:hypothetical protein
MSFESTPQTPNALAGLEAYAEARRTIRWEERCACCPVMFRGRGVASRCCRWPTATPKRGLWRRLKARVV